MELNSSCPSFYTSTKSVLFTSSEMSVLVSYTGWPVRSVKSHTTCFRVGSIGVGGKKRESNVALAQFRLLHETKRSGGGSRRPSSAYRSSQRRKHHACTHPILPPSRNLPRGYSLELVRFYRSRNTGNSFIRARGDEAGRRGGARVSNPLCILGNQKWVLGLSIDWQGLCKTKSKRN